ncbi:MAG: Omp28-related outer membrane protein, partial [Bacteroidetes bacterium]|nr:Omp28-related outer membrane protein [Bacteroidota bacterium]
SSGSYQNITHNHVSRLCLSSNVAGDDLMAGKPTSGTVISKEFSGSIDAAWKKENLTVIAVIWRQKGNSLVFENVDKIDL